MKFLRSLLKWIIMAGICYGGYLGWQEWKKFDAILDELQAKHPEKHELMMKEFDDYNFKEAKKLFYELDAMTENEVTWLRYNKLKKKWTEDKKFQFESMKERHLFRKKENERMDIIYKKRVEIVKHYGDDKAEWLPAAWKQMEPWEKGEMLRENCIHYLQQEIDEERNRQGRRGLPRHTTLLKKSATQKLTPSQLCENWVPLNSDEEGVEVSLGRLKNNLIYSHYKDMLERLGIPVEETFSFPNRFKRLTDELAG